MKPYYQDRTELLSLAGKKGGNAIKHQWQDWECDIVRRDYDGTNRSAELIAAKLGVTRCAVKGQVQKMGIAMDKSPRWTKHELDLLEQMNGKYSITTISRKLHRSTNAVAVKLKRLKLSRWAHDDWFTKKEISEICGVDHKKVQSWIDSNALKASWHDGHKPSKYGMSMWHIELKDFRDFLIKYSGELLGRNTDIQQIIWIVSDYKVLNV